MSHEVFISYSSIDRETADRLCRALEESGTATWIAPRDVMPGKPYGEALIDAINDSKVMVLVLSEHSNHSSQVVREVERAASKGIPIIPFRIAEVRLAKSLEYFLSTCHWLDAIGGEVQTHLPRLTEAVNATLRAVYEGETLALDPALSGAANRPRPAGPKRRGAQSAVLAESMDESIYQAEVIAPRPADAPTAPPQRRPQPRKHAPQQPVQPPRGGNALGVAGLTASILGLLTCGMFSPIGLLLSLIGLRKAPRGASVGGTAIGAIGSCMFAVFFAYGFFGGFTTALELEEAASEMDAYYAQAGDYPSDEEAAYLLADNQDAWNQSLRYHRNWDGGYEIRSAGLDGAFNTSDDHTVKR